MTMPFNLGTYWTDDGGGAFSIDSPDGAFNTLDSTNGGETIVGLVYKSTYTVTELSGADTLSLFLITPRIDGTSTGVFGSIDMVTSAGKPRFARASGSGAFTSSINSVSVKRFIETA
jgi:hypothetical protein